MKFNIFPIPKYFKTKKIVKRVEIKKPLLLFAKIKEKVKREDKKNTTKKRGKTKNELGLKK